MMIPGIKHHGPEHLEDVLILNITKENVNLLRDDQRLKTLCPLLIDTLNGYIVVNLKNRTWHVSHAINWMYRSEPDIYSYIEVSTILDNEIQELEKLKSVKTFFEIII